MATPRNHFLLFLNLAFLFSAAIATKVNTENQPTVYIINSMPPNSQSIEVNCSSASSPIVDRELLVTEAYQLNVESKIPYLCIARMTQRRYIQIFDAYLPSRDKAHCKIYWLVNQDGFYLSWDRDKWVRKALWQSE
ncbi:hypothetical protein Tsubulata_019039 [Turnera subulata]|uniref:S-protein homolog n=1 Tax=Turnera subulata TaxID=218843 RepID=A0A9Q0FD61_9ROSI|nr:hypothetical protein Tsubulata_019039 [Turnera subulata]